MMSVVKTNKTVVYIDSTKNKTIRNNFNADTLAYTL